MKSKILGLLAVGLLAGPMAARAVVLYEHAFPNANTNAWCTPCYGNYRVWDVFDLASNASIASIDAHLYANDVSGYAGQVSYSVWTADRSTELFSQVFNWSDLLTTDTGFNRWDVTALLTGLNLSAGSYALSIYGLSEDTLAWWQTTSTVNGRSFQSDGGSGSNRDMAFRINGSTVPEPGTLALLGLGLAGLGLSRRRKAA